MNFDNLPKHAVQSLERCQVRLGKRKGQLHRWSDVAAEIGVSLGSCVRVANGYYPRTPELCQKFGLPVLSLGVICPVHGRVCSVQHRPPKPEAERKPRPGWGRKPYNRIWDENTLD